MSIDTYFCLCCFSTENMNNLFDVNCEKNYAVLLKELFAITPTREDEDDSYICSVCIEKLKAAQSFKKQVFNSIKVLQDMGLVNLRKENGDLIIQKVKLPLDESKNVPEEEIKKQNQIDRQDGKETNQTLTVEQVKANKLKNITITDNADIIRNYISNTIDPVKILQEHIITHTTRNELYDVPEDLTCGVCGLKLPNVYGFHTHMNMHCPNHICEVCGRGYATERKLKRHKYIHDRGPFVCQDCGAQYNNYSTYSQHWSIKHTSLRRYRCALCPARFATLARRARHAADTHNSATWYSCTVCAKQFLTTALLNTHMKCKHLKLKKFLCSTCDAAFFHKQDLEGHMVTHNGLNPYTCHVCDKSFPRKKSLTVHLKIHTNEKRYCCDTCGMRFIQKCTLTSHLKTHNREKIRIHSNNIQRDDSKTMK